MPILYTKAGTYGGRLPVSWWGQANSAAWYANLGDELTPNTPIIDVVKDFPWTLTPTTSQARKEAPYIYLREFLQVETQLNQCLLPYGKTQPGTISSFQEEDVPLTESAFGLIGELASAIDPNTNNLYKGLFDHLIPTNFVYRLPYFTSEYFDIKNNWEATDVLDKIIDVQTQIGSFGRAAWTAVIGEKGEGIGKFLQSLPSLYKQIEIFNLKAGNPTVGLMDPPHVWKNTANRSYTFEFPLYNISSTGQTDTENLIVKNWEFCYLLTYQNLVNKRNFYTGIPPVFYEVLIPGIHYCKASYISDLTITNLGNIRLLQLPLNGSNRCDVNVPDAYSVKITFTDLLQPSKNLLTASVNSLTRSNIQEGEI